MTHKERTELIEKLCTKVLKKVEKEKKRIAFYERDKILNKRLMKIRMLGSPKRVILWNLIYHYKNDMNDKIEYVMKTETWSLAKANSIDPNYLTKILKAW